MGQFISKVKGITFRVEGKDIYNYHENDMLRLVPDPNNPYDKNAIAIYDTNNNHIGYVGKEDNVKVLNIIKNMTYVCRIKRVYYDYNTPSIEYEIIFDEKNHSFENNNLEDADQHKTAKLWKDNLIDRVLYLLDNQKYKEAIDLIENSNEQNNEEILYYLGGAYYY